MSSDVAGQAVADGEETDSRMALKVEIKEIGACRKHISVTVPEADIRTNFQSRLLVFPLHIFPTTCRKRETFLYQAMIC